MCVHYWECHLLFYKSYFKNLTKLQVAGSIFSFEATPSHFFLVNLEEVSQYGACCNLGIHHWEVFLWKDSFILKKMGADLIS